VPRNHRTTPGRCELRRRADTAPLRIRRRARAQFNRRGTRVPTRLTRISGHRHEGFAYVHSTTVCDDLLVSACTTSTLIPSKAAATMSTTLRSRASEGTNSRAVDRRGCDSGDAQRRRRLDGVVDSEAAAQAERIATNHPLRGRQQTFDQVRRSQRRRAGKSTGLPCKSCNGRCWMRANDQRSMKHE
jgi:hypothetical protein